MLRTLTGRKLLRALFSGPIIIFIIGIVATAFLFGAVEIEYGTTDFFQKHGIFFLIFITLFPRLTLLFSSVATGGVLWWLGWFFYPRLLVAVLATVAYLHTNPILVAISWFVALSGEFAEKKGLVANKRFIVRHYGTGGFNRGPQDIYQRQQPVSQQSDVIEAEFSKKE